MIYKCVVEIIGVLFMTFQGNRENQALPTKAVTSITHERRHDKVRYRNINVVGRARVY